MAHHGVGRPTCGMSGPAFGSMSLASSNSAQAHSKQMVTGGPPEHHLAVTAIGTKLCATGSSLIGGDLDPGPLYLNGNSHRLRRVTGHLLSALAQWYE